MSLRELSHIEKKGREEYSSLLTCYLENRSPYLRVGIYTANDADEIAELMGSTKMIFLEATTRERLQLKFHTKEA